MQPKTDAKTETRTQRAIRQTRCLRASRPTRLDSCHIHTTLRLTPLPTSSLPTCSQNQTPPVLQTKSDRRRARAHVDANPTEPSASSEMKAPSTRTACSTSRTCSETQPCAGSCNSTKQSCRCRRALVLVRARRPRHAGRGAGEHRPAPGGDGALHATSDHQLQRASSALHQAELQTTRAGLERRRASCEDLPRTSRARRFGSAPATISENGASL